MNRNDRLNFKKVLRASALAMRAKIEGRIIVERHADEIGDWVLRLLGESRVVVPFRVAGRLIRLGVC
jgi:hypothetical protein